LHHCCKTSWRAMFRVLPPSFKPANNLICCKTGLMLHVFPYIKWCANPNPSLHGMVIPTRLSCMLTPNPVSMLRWSQTCCSLDGMPIPAPVSMVCWSQPWCQWYADLNTSPNSNDKLIPTKVLMVCRSQSQLIPYYLSITTHPWK